MQYFEHTQRFSTALENSVVTVITDIEINIKSHNGVFNTDVYDSITLSIKH